MPTLDTYVRNYVLGRWRRGELGDAARDAYTATLLGFSAAHGERPAKQCGPATVDRWLETTTHLSPTTRRNALSRVRGFCRYLQAQGIIRRDPTTHVPHIRAPHREPVTFTRAEVRALIAALPDLRAKVIVALMDDTAARCADVALLRCEDVNLDAGTVLLRAKGHERLNPISPATCRLIAAYLLETGARHGHLIRNRNDPSAGVTAATISHYVRDWMWAAGIKRRPGDGRSAHGLRRTCLSELMEACGDLQVVQEVAGHVRPDTTVRHYLRRASSARKREAMVQRAELGEAA